MVVEVLNDWAILHATKSLRIQCAEIATSEIGKLEKAGAGETGSEGQATVAGYQSCTTLVDVIGNYQRQVSQVAKYNQKDLGTIQCSVLIQRDLLEGISLSDHVESMKPTAPFGF